MKTAVFDIDDTLIDSKWNGFIHNTVEKLKELSKAVDSEDEVAQVGTISANGDTEIGKLLSQAMLKVGRDGIITVEDAKGMMTTLDVVDGMQFERGYKNGPMMQYQQAPVAAPAGDAKQ
jgi:chaperonin GroEL (HSP60 family)